MIVAISDSAMSWVVQMQRQKQSMNILREQGAAQPNIRSEIQAAFPLGTRSM
jgi:hypothetical protein